MDLNACARSGTKVRSAKIRRPNARLANVKMVESAVRLLMVSHVAAQLDSPASTVRQQSM